MRIYKIDTGEEVEARIVPERVPVPDVRETIEASFNRAVAGFKRMWPASFVLWLVGLAGAALPAVMVGRVLETAIGRSLMADRLLRGFDAAWYREFVHAHGSRLEAVPLVAIPAAAATLVVYLIVLGGVLDQLVLGDSFRLKRLFRTGAGHLRALLIQTACFLPLLAVVFLANKGLVSLTDGPIERTSSEPLAMGLTGLRLLVIFLLLLLYRIGLDYARISLVAAADVSAWRATVRGFGFIRRRPLLASLPLPSGLAAGLALVLLYNGVAVLIRPGGVVTVALLILVQGLFLAAWQGLRLFVYSWEAAAVRLDERAPSEP